MAANPWTIPSHASIFTGTYPWVHGVHIPGRLALGPQPPTLAEELRRRGYSTACFSANGFLSPAFGLLRGFGTGAWGDWWERYLRLPDRVRPPGALGTAGRAEPTRRGLWQSLEVEARLLHRVPLPMNLANRAVEGVCGGGHGTIPSVAPWVEPTLERWLSEQPPHQPVFCFVNLLDAHEPYLSPRSFARSALEWLHQASIRQDRANALAGDWWPTSEESRHLHRLYREEIRVLDGRLRRIVEAFRSSGRWDRTMMVVTSDHGQAFGEHHHLFHQTQVWEQVLRVPLWVRPPGGGGGGKRAVGWASHVDLLPTLVQAAGGGLPSRTAEGGVELATLLDSERPGPVLAMADGVPPQDPLLARATPERIAELNHPWVVGYQGSLKIVLDPARNAWRVFDVDEDPDEQRDLSTKAEPSMEPLREKLRAVGARVLQQRNEGLSLTVMQRLRSWGYL